MTDYLLLHTVKFDPVPPEHQVHFSGRTVAVLGDIKFYYFFILVQNILGFLFKIKKHHYVAVLLNATALTEI